MAILFVLTRIFLKKRHNYAVKNVTKLQLKQILPYNKGNMNYSAFT